MDRHDESDGTTTGVSWWDRENIGPDFTCDLYRRRTRESSRCTTSLRETSDRGFLRSVRPDREYQLGCPTTRHRCHEGIAMSVEDTVHICESLICRIPRSAHSGSETVESESHSESLEDRHRTIRAKCPITESTHDSEFCSFTDIWVIPYIHAYITETWLCRSPRERDSLRPEEHLQYLGSCDRVTWSEVPVVISRYHALTRECGDRVPIPGVLGVRK